MITPLADEILGEYVLHEKLGEGGMGVVYRATNRLSGQCVALKRVHSPLRDGVITGDTESYTTSATGIAGESIGIRTALAHEFQTLASLYHPNIVGVLDYGFTNQQSPFFTMELLSNPRTIVEASEEKSIQAKVTFLVQLLQALAYLHRRNILHRDIKPSNVLVVGDQVKLVDFGIAEVAGANQRVAGTLQYMAPELYLGSPPSIESDLYAVGVIAFELITHRLPHQATSRTSFLESILGDDLEKTLLPDVIEMMSGFGGTLEEEPESDSVVLDQYLTELSQSSSPIAEIVTKLLARLPHERYHDALHVIRDLAIATGQPLPIETAATRESFLQAAEFIGRDEELEMLSTAITDAEHRRGSIWLISGESGVGKSRLAREVRINALVRSARVARGQGVIERSANYSLWNSIIRTLCLDTELDDSQVGTLKDIAPDIDALLMRTVPTPAGLSPQAAQARLHSAVVSLLEKQQRPVVLFLDDLQWAGSESVELLAYLSPIIQRMPIVIIGTYRDDEATEELRTLPFARQLRLGRLQETQIARLCESMLGPAGHNPELVRYLKKQTEGNVFFLVETVRSLAERAGELNLVGQHSLPAELLTGGIERFIQHRLAQVPAAYDALLDLAAVIGRQLDMRVLEHATGQHDLSGFLIVCANASVLEAQQSEWQFSHDKIREWIIKRQNETETRQLHCRVAEAITALYKDDPAKCAALGYHWDKADVPEKAYGYYMKAGAAAARLYAIIEARVHYTAALGVLDRLEDTLHNRRRKVDTLFLVIGLSIQTSILPQFPVRLDHAAELLAPLLSQETVDPEDTQRLTRIQFWKGRCSMLLGELDKAIEYCQTTIELAAKYGLQDVYASSCFFIGQCKFMQGHMGACWPYYMKSLEWLETRRLSADWTRVIGSQGVSLVARGKVQAGLKYLNQAIEVAKDPTLIVTILAYFVTAHACMRDWAVAKEHAAKLRELAEANNDLRFAAIALWGLAQYEAWLGNFAASNEYRDRANRFSNKEQFMTGHDWRLAGDAEVFLLQGRTAEAIKIAEDTILVAQRFGGIYSQGLCHRVLGQALVLQPTPNWDAATGHMAQSLKFFEQGEAWLESAHTHAILAKLLHQQGNISESVKHYSHAIERYEAFELHSLLASTRAELAGVVAA